MQPILSSGIHLLSRAFPYLAILKRCVKEHLSSLRIEQITTLDLKMRVLFMCFFNFSQYNLQFMERNVPLQTFTKNLSFVSGIKLNSLASEI